jgi:membrane-associated phospholipid phosphatase
MMISITELVQSIDIEIIKSIGWILNDSLLYGLVLIGLILAGERRPGKIKKIFFSVALAIIIGMAIKELIAQERPCFGDEWCPHSFSFPSTHAVAAFTLMTGFIRKRSYLFYLAFALFICFTRLNLGVHTFQDIAAALPIALISYYITWEVIKDEKGN